MRENNFLPPIKSKEKRSLNSDLYDSSSSTSLYVRVNSTDRCDKNYKDMYETCREELMVTKRKLSEEKVQSRNYLIEAKEHRLETLKLTLTGSKQEQMIKKLREQVEELRNEKKAWLKMKKIYFEEELWKEKTDEEKGDGERRRRLREKKVVGKKNSRTGEKQVDSVRKSGEKIGSERGQKEVIDGKKDRRGKKESVTAKKSGDRDTIRTQKGGVRQSNGLPKLGENTRGNKGRRESKSLKEKRDAKVKNKQKGKRAEDQANMKSKPGHGVKFPQLDRVQLSPSPDLQSEADHGRYEIPSVFTPLPLMEKLISWKPPLPPSAQLPAEYRMERRKEAILKKIV